MSKENEKATWEIVAAVFLLSFYLIDVRLFTLIVVAISFNELATMCLDVCFGMVKQFTQLVELDKRTEES